MSWISTNNLRRFADNLFHGKLSFSGNVTHNGAVEFNGGVKVNTVKAEFTAPVSFTGTATYKNNEIATKADIVAGGGITVDDALSSTSTNPVQNKVIKGALDNVLSISSPNGSSHVVWDGSNRLTVTNMTDTDLGSSVVIDSDSISCLGNAGKIIGVISNGSSNGVTSYDSDTNKTHILSLNEKLQYGELSNNTPDNIATEAYVKANYVQLSNGHISINGSELWVE